MKRLKGINRDSGPVDQPEGTYRNAENLVLTERLGALTSEGGTTSQLDLSTIGNTGYEIIGSTLVHDGRQILFMTDGTNSEIGEFDGQNYTLILNDSLLSDTMDFETGSVVEAVTIINDKDEVVLYWTDDVNPPRWLNIDDDPELTQESNDLRLFPHIDKAPVINLNSINPSGGSLKTGSYYFAIALIDSDGSRTNYMSVSPPVYINDDSQPGNYSGFDGAEAGTATSKSIQLSIDNLDQAYDEYQLAVIRKEAGTIGDVEILPESPLSDSSVVYTYSGIENSTGSTLQEIVANTASYDLARTIAEQDDTLYLGNLKKKEGVGYQKYANNITVEAISKPLDNGDSNVKEGAHYGDGEISFYDKSFKRGEVYALYIAFVLENGRESQAYHIPGRQSDGTTETETTTYNGVKRYKLEALNGTNNMGFWQNENETYPDTEDFEVWDVDGSGNGFQKTTGETTLRNKNVRHHHFREVVDENFYRNSKFETLGIKLSNVKIPADIAGRVRAVKVYYAKRTDDNRRVVDQGAVIPAHKNKTNEEAYDIQDDYVYSFLDHSQSGYSDALFFWGFNSLRTRKSMGSVSHIKYIGEPSGDMEKIKDDDTQTYTFTASFIDQTESLSHSSTSFPEIDTLSGITYVGEDTFIRNAISEGFDYNIANLYNGPVLAIQTDNDTPVNNFNSASSLSDTDVSLIKIVELLQVRDDLYFPFDQQELEWTGIIETDIDQFDPRNSSSSAGSIASGTIDITAGVDTDAASATGEIEITSDATGADTITIEFTMHYETFSVTYDTGSSETKLSIAQGIRDALNAHELFSYAYTATVDDSGTNPIVVMDADKNGTLFNNSFTVDDAGSGIASSTTGNFTNGSDSGLLEAVAPIGYIEASTSYTYDTSGSITVGIEATDQSGGSELTGIIVQINSGDTASDVALKIHDKLEAETTLDEYTFVQSDNRVYAFSTGTDKDYEGVTFTFSENDVADLSKFGFDYGRYADQAAVNVVITTPALNKSINVPLSKGDSAATVETTIVTTLNNDADFSSLFTASDNAPILIESDNNGDEHNGQLDISPLGSGVTSTDTDLTGGTDGVTPFVVLGYGGDTFINLSSFRYLGIELNPTVPVTNIRLYHFPAESDDNIKLRHEGDLGNEIYYPKSTKNNVLLHENENSSDSDPFETDLVANYIGYNRDYSATAEIKSAIPMDKDYDQITSFSTRVIRSAEGDTTQNDAGIRTFLESDYMDLTKSRGELVTLVVMQNTLMPHMERSLIRTKGREELTTGDFRTFIGAGDIFSVKPDEIVSTPTGFAGLQDQRCSMVTPAGYFFVDREAGEVYLVGPKGPEVISERGLKNFFDEELSAASSGELICGYDHEWDRIMLTRKGQWTLSYYPSLKAWGSFHSYDPEYYLYDLDTFYTLKSDNIYEHNLDGSPGFFYGSIKSSKFRFVENRNPRQSKVFFNIEYIAEVEDSSGDKIWDTTFDKFRVYNDRQDSGEKSIVYFTGTDGNARNVEGTWRINKFRDMLVNGTIDTNKPWQDQSRFIGKYLQVELIFNNSGGNSIYLYDAKASAKRSLR